MDFASEDPRDGDSKDFRPGDLVKILTGTYANFHGEVRSVEGEFVFVVPTKFPAHPTPIRFGRAEVKSLGEPEDLSSI